MSTKDNIKEQSGLYLVLWVCNRVIIGLWFASVVIAFVNVIGFLLGFAFNMRPLIFMIIGVFLNSLLSYIANKIKND